MAESGSTIYVVHSYGGEWEDRYDFVEAAFTSFSAAVAFVERDLGAIEKGRAWLTGARQWGRWTVETVKGEDYEYWGPEPEGVEYWEDDEGEDDDTEPTHPFDYVFFPDEFESYEIKRLVLDSGECEQVF